MRYEFQGTGRQEPNEVAENDVPRWEMKATLKDRHGALVHDISNERGSSEKGEWVEELVDLQSRRSRVMSLHGWQGTSE